MNPSVDTTDVREPRPFKLNAYVHPDRAEYLKKLAKDNSRKISGQLDLLLREHEAQAKSPISKQADTLKVCLNGIERKADIIRMAAAIPPKNQNTKRHAGEIMALVEAAKKWV